MAVYYRYLSQQAASPLRPILQMCCRRKTVTFALLLLTIGTFLLFHYQSRVVPAAGERREPIRLNSRVVQRSPPPHSAGADDSEEEIAGVEERAPPEAPPALLPDTPAAERPPYRPREADAPDEDLQYSDEISVSGKRTKRPHHHVDPADAERQVVGVNRISADVPQFEQQAPPAPTARVTTLGNEIKKEGFLPTEGKVGASGAAGETGSLFKVQVQTFKRDWKVETVAPVKTPASPVPEAGEPARETPGANVKPAGDVVKSPGIEVTSPVTGVKSPRTEVKSPDTKVKSPHIEVKSPGTQVKSPRTDAKSSGTDVKPAGDKSAKDSQVTGDALKTKLDVGESSKTAKKVAASHSKLNGSNFAKNLAMLSPQTDMPPGVKAAKSVVAAGGGDGGSIKRVAGAGYELPPGVEVVEHKLDEAAEAGNNIHSMLKLRGVVPSFPIHDGRPKRVQLASGTWQVVQDSWEIYLFSAWYDDRETLDVPAVRVIAVAEESAKYVYCLHWYEGQALPDAALADITPVGPKIVPIGNKKYEQYLFSCGLVPKRGRPQYVSVITPNNVVPSTLLPVQVADKHPNTTHEFGHCMSVVYWHHDPIRVVEWLELNKMLGVGEVTVYNNSLSDDVSAVFLHYQKEGYVDFRQAPNIIDHPSEFMILLNMSPAINDCLYRNMYRYKRVVCFDLDEVIFPRGFTTFAEVLAATDAKLNITHPHQCYMFRNSYFFDDFKPVAEEPWFLWTQRYLKRVKPSQFGYSVKSITDPMTCVGLQNHVCWKRVPRYEKTTWNVEVPPKYAMNQHYKRCHFDKYLKEEGACRKMMKDVYVDKAALRFGGELYDRVAKRLLELDMADEADEKERAEVVNKLKEAHGGLKGLEKALS